MQHKVRLTVIDKKLYPELQTQYCANPNAGECSCYNIGDEFIFERYGNADDFWHMGLGTLVKTDYDPDKIAGGKKIPHCSEAWDAISRYIYTGLQGGSIMRRWMNDDRIMITCCSDGTRPVIFKVERLDYKALYIEGIGCDKCRNKISDALSTVENVKDVIFKDEFTEVFLEKEVEDEMLKSVVENCGGYMVTRIE
ncbi:MAG: TIGR04076 family protein [Lachnospiraceae bacterium]|nr:TIGR04076 family protein [Lachnospiraceae bacterium]MDD3616046.1 TIGR04076 family protein [Lachnospiraceae bacterium]